MPLKISVQRNVFIFSGWNLFLLLIGFNALLNFSTNFLFITEGLYYQSFGEQLAVDRIAKMFEMSQKWQWIGYLFIPIIVLLRVGFTATCLFIGCSLENSQIRFKQLFKLSLLADFVFVLAKITKFAILIFFKDVSRLQDLKFRPLSLLELFQHDSVDEIFIYPFSLISVFEFLYWLVLAWLLSALLEKPFGNSLKRVASSYGIGLLLWVLFVMFQTVNQT